MLTEEKAVAIALTFQGKSAEDIGEKVGKSSSTISNWRQEPEFHDALDRIQEATVYRLSETIPDRILRIADKALIRLEERLDNPECGYRDIQLAISLLKGYDRAPRPELPKKREKPGLSDELIEQVKRDILGCCG